MVKVKEVVLSTQANQRWKAHPILFRPPPKQIRMCHDPDFFALRSANSINIFDFWMTASLINPPFFV